MKDWMHAKKKEIENMTFDQAKEIVEKQMVKKEASGVLVSI